MRWEEIDVIFGEVDACFEGSDESYKLLFYWGYLAREGAAQMLCGDAGLVEGGGFDEIANCFSLREIQATGEEGSLGEFARFGEARTGGDALAEEVVEEDGRAMAGDFYDVFGGVRVGSFEERDYGFVEDFTCRIKDFGEAGLRGGEGVAEFQKGFGDGACGGAGEADDADATAAGWGGDSDDGVFELDHMDFLMVTGEKILGWWSGVFAGGFAKSGVQKVVFDGENVVEVW